MRSDFEPQRHGQLVRGQHLEIVGVVRMRGAVERAAVRFHGVEVDPFGAFAEPWNIMCSNRWAKPVRPFCFGPRAPTS